MNRDMKNFHVTLRNEILSDNVKVNAEKCYSKYATVAQLEIFKIGTLNLEQLKEHTPVITRRLLKLLLDSKLTDLRVASIEIIKENLIFVYYGIATMKLIDDKRKKDEDEEKNDKAYENFEEWPQAEMGAGGRLVRLIFFY